MAKFEKNLSGMTLSSNLINCVTEPTHFQEVVTMNVSIARRRHGSQNPVNRGTVTRKGRRV